MKKKEFREQSQPGYYSVIIAPVRYDKNLSLGAKLLYGEITALCNKEGYCWAKNEYFAEIYGKQIRMIQYWMNNLKEQGYIDYELHDNKFRRIWTTNHAINCTTPCKKLHTPHAKNCTSSINNIDNNIKNNYKNFLKNISKRSGKTERLSDIISQMNFPGSREDNGTSN